MDAEAAQALREPFPAGMVGKLPKPTRKDNPRDNCRECGGYHGMPAVHLDYVGHAATTDRLIKVDPCWTWEPLALDERGLPAYDRDGGMWIKLTILGVTRLGYGDGTSIKEMIGDAIRNAAMRFGVALDLWAKEDLHAEPAKTPMTASQQTEIAEVIAGLADDEAAELKAWWKREGLPKMERLSRDEAAVVLDRMEHTPTPEDKP